MVREMYRSVMGEVATLITLVYCVLKLLLAIDCTAIVKNDTNEESRTVLVGYNQCETILS